MSTFIGILVFTITVLCVIVCRLYSQALDLAAEVAVRNVELATCRDEKQRLSMQNSFLRARLYGNTRP